MSTRAAGPVAVLAALEIEAAAITSQLEPSPRRSPVSLWEGELGGAPVAVAVTGVGKVAAAMAAQLACDLLSPRCLLSVGIAGATHDGAHPGAVWIVEAAVQHDMDARPLTRSRGAVPGFQAIELDADAGLVSTLLDSARAELPDGRAVGLALTLTGDQVITSRDSRDALVAEFPRGECVDMETAAIAQVAIRNAVPWAGVRVTSDMADEAFDLAEVLAFAQDASRIIERVIRRAVPAL